MSEQRSEGNEPDDAARRPEFGAFATPDEQARRRGTADQHEKDAGGHARPTPPAGSKSAWRAATPAKQPAPPLPGMVPLAPNERSERNRRADRFVAYVLLALGFLNVVSSAPAYLALQSTLNMAYEQLGAGPFDNPELASAMGVAIVIVQAVIWVATFALTLTRIRAGRLAWWVPVVGAFVAFIALAVMLTVVMATDVPSMTPAPSPPAG
ncbi:DUF6264 family protein [Ruicaihuangia caeni]|uniref:DUF6264 family protein n=1 Tax=Ruicaihuangia caeni TaxID=3042517 RepID=A0AAW6T8D8_9MICO|nr:DUF6264 family protein [Klugiella sp. YN-L-19]MDI2099489.1 DUF6264 family protein [Klugiella sp. YN-L-19]